MIYYHEMFGIKRLVLIFLGVLFLGSPMVWGKQMVKEILLDNGLKVVLVNDPSASLVSVRTIIRAGSIDEDAVLGSGVSHYLEHLVAGGTTKARSEETYRRLIAQLGGAYNAYTTVDHTSYFINTVPSEMNTAIAMLSEWMFQCEFSSSEFNRERDVIIKEIEKDDASVHRKFYQISNENFYKVNPIRYPVIGYLDNFKRLTQDNVRAYYQSRYVASNMLLVIGGNFNEDVVMAQVRGTFGKAPTVAPPKVQVGSEPMPFSARSIETTGDTSVTFLSLRFPTIDLFSKDLYALDLLEFILSEGEDSFLHRQIVEEKKLAYAVRASSYTPSFTTGYFEIVMEVDADKVEAAKKEVLSILSSIKAGKFDEARLARACKQKLAEDIFSITSIDDRVSRFGTGVLYGHSTSFYDDYIRRFRGVKKQDVQDVATHYLDPERMVSTVMYPDKKGKLLSSTKNVSGVVLPTPHEHVLKNGVRVLLYPDHALPQVFTKIFVLGGLRAETVSQNGIGNFLADLMGKDSDLYSKQKIQTLMEDNGAIMHASMGQNTFYYGLDCLSEDVGTLFPVFFHTFLHAKFVDKAECDETRRKVLKSIGQRQDDWFRYGSYYTRKAFFSGHPYGLSALGEEASVKSISLPDVKAHYQYLLNPSAMVVSVFGDFDEKIVLKEIEKQFLAFKPSDSLFDASLKTSRVLHTGPSFEQPKISQDVSGLFIAFDGVSYEDPSEVLKLDLVDAVLSGASYPGGRFHHILRDKGYVYMVHADSQAGLERGVFVANALTSPDKVDEVQKIMLAQIEDIKQKPISDTEFSEAIAQLRFSYQDRVSSLESKLMASSTDLLYGLGQDYYVRVLDEISKLKKEDVIETAKKYLVNPQIFVFQK